MGSARRTRVHQAPDEVNFTAVPGESSDVNDDPDAGWYPPVWVFGAKARKEKMELRSVHLMGSQPFNLPFEAVV